MLRLIRPERASVSTAAQPISHLRPTFATIGRDQQDDAVILVLLANPPGPPQLIAIVGNVITAEVWHC